MTFNDGVAEFVDEKWPLIKTAIDVSIFALDTNLAGNEYAIKLAADIAIGEWVKAHATD